MYFRKPQSLIGFASRNKRCVLCCPSAETAEDIVVTQNTSNPWQLVHRVNSYGHLESQHENRNYIIFFGALHFLVWLIMFLWLGWWGIIAGFLTNGVIDASSLLLWIWQEKHPEQKNLLKMAHLLLKKRRN